MRRADEFDVQFDIPLCQTPSGTGRDWRFQKPVWSFRAARFLLSAQRGHRADARRTTRGKPGRDESGGGEQGGRDRESNRVQRADFVEHSA